MPRPQVQKKTLRDSLPIDMLLSAVSVLVVAQSSSEIPEGLMNNPVYCFECLEKLTLCNLSSQDTVHCKLSGLAYISPTRRVDLRIRSGLLKDTEACSEGTGLSLSLLS